MLLQSGVINAAGELILGDVLCIYIVVLRVQTLMSIYILWGIAQQGITIYIYIYMCYQQRLGKGRSHGATWLRLYYLLTSLKYSL